MAEAETITTSGGGGVTAGSTAKSVLVLAVIWGMGVGLSFLADAPDDPFIGTISIVQTVAILSFAINSVAFVPAFMTQSERGYDITGSACYLTCTWYSYAAGFDAGGGVVRARPLIASIFVTIWAARLGTFLFARIMRDGKDGRFDEIKPDAFRFFNVWNLQGLWVFLTAYAVYIANASTVDTTLGPLDFVGIVVWVVGFGIEAVADHQKQVWRRDPSNRGKFIEVGLWWYSRHPNYFGETVLWLGQFLLCASTFEDTQWAAVLAPIFVFCLLNFVSGVPLLEKRSDEKWGGQPDYEEYKATTSTFVILPKRGQRTVALPLTEA